jgi:hypothetical protein
MGSFINGQEKSKNTNKANILNKLDESLFIFNNFETKSYNKYSIEKLNPHLKEKISEILRTFDTNGIPRNSDDFNHKNFSKFYPKQDPFFKYDNTGLIHNYIIIYNENQEDLSQMEIYEGDLNQKGQRHGLGKLVTQYYELKGLWKNDMFSGWGRQSRCNGEIYEGRFENGLLNGKGIFLDKKSNKYIGEFKNMKKWGKGKLISDKIIYEGDFINNKKEGKGRIKFLESNVIYEGTFINDNIEGYGIFKYTNGNIYEGEVKNWKMNGNGAYKYRNGKILKGRFVDNKIVNYENIQPSFYSPLIRQSINNEFGNEKFFYHYESKKIINNEENENNANNYILDYKIQSDIDPYLQPENDINQNIFDINEFKENNDFNIDQNNNYILNNVNKINEFITDKYNEEKNMIMNTNEIYINNPIDEINEQPKLEENPDILFSSYRNFGFGESDEQNFY